MSLKLIRALSLEGFDHATAETVVRMADDKPPDEARTLLVGMLGAENSHIEEYVKAREAAKQKELAQLNRLATSDVSQAIEAQKSKAKPGKVYTTKEKSEYVKDLEAAVARLSLGAADRPKCDCLGTRHGLLEMAPNCLHCGRIVCNKEGLGPCLFCGHVLLPDEQVREILGILREQRDSVVATMSKKALAAAGIDPSTRPDSKAIFSSAKKAQQNLERLLGYQDNDAVRTRIIDQVGDVDVPAMGTNMWATPAEQAEQLKLQQRRLRKLEEERKARTGQGRKVVSIDIRGNKVYQTFEDAPLSSDEDDQDTPADAADDENDLSRRDRKLIAYFDPKKVKVHSPPQLPSADQNTSSSNPEREDASTLHIVYDAEEELLY